MEFEGIKKGKKLFSILEAWWILKETLKRFIVPYYSRLLYVELVNKSEGIEYRKKFSSLVEASFILKRL
jgi:hypothetical protein